ncbi:hypothetical protein [Kalamiella sp. sgz302252]|uniref:hypothetical protein n=1 Tax=Pantoea sp. sgz302252 TaxID=3341827 RepID=UPI0036D24407
MDKNQERQDELIQQLAARPGNHTGNRDRQQVASAAVQLLSILSSVRNTHTGPALTAKRADRLAIENKLAHVDNLLSNQRVERAFNRELSRNTRQKSPAEGAPAKRDGSFAPCAATSSGAGSFNEPVWPEKGPSLLTSGAGNSVKPVSGGNILSTMLSPVVDALHETDRLISQYDPLRFPGAEASVQRAAPKSRTPQTNRALNKFLIKRGLLRVKKTNHIPLIKTLNGVSQYLAVSPDGLTHLAARLPGGQLKTDTGETVPLPKEYAPIVFYRWLSNQVLGMDPEQWLAKKMATHALNEESTVGELEQLLAADAVLPHNGRHSAEAELKKLWNVFVRDTFPIFAIDSARSLLLHDMEWGMVHAGSLVLKEMGVPIADIDMESARYMGNLFLTLIQEDSLPKDFDAIRLFRLQALLEYVRRHSQEIDPNRTEDWEHIIERVDGELLKSYKHYQENNVVGRFNKALSHWKTRRQVIESWIKSYTIANPGKKQYTVDEYMDQNFMGSSNVRYNNPPPILPVEKSYASLTSHVADSFAELDKPLVTAALSSLDDNETLFIQGAEIKLASARLSMPHPPVNAHDRGWGQWTHARADSELLSNVDLFTASKNNEERIYALKGEEGGYTLYRVDRNKEKYCLNKLMNNCQNNKYPESKLSISTRDRIKSPSDDLTAFIDNLVQAHREVFYTNLYEKGYEKTTTQKIRDFLPSLIPFYDCTKSINSGDTAGASISCTLDVIAFIPVLGEMASLAGRFASSAAEAALRAAGRTALNAATRDAIQNGIFKQTIKSIGREVLRDIAVPTTSELFSVGKHLLQSIDPGFMLINDVGKLGKILLKRMAKKINHMPVPLKELVDKLERNIDEIAGVVEKKTFNPGEISVPEMPGGVKPSLFDLPANKGELSPVNSLDDLFNSNPCTGTRFRRGLDDLCAPPGNRFSNMPDDNRIFPLGVNQLTNNQVINIELVRLSALERLHPVRHEILERLLANQIKISDTAVLALSSMSDADLVKFIQKSYRLPITEENAKVLRNYIKELNTATRVINNERDTRVMVALDNTLSNAQASYIYGQGVMFVNERFFRSSPMEMLSTILHESSHATGTQDYLYHIDPFSGKEYEGLQKYTDINTLFGEYRRIRESDISKRGVQLITQPQIKTIINGEEEVALANKIIGAGVLFRDSQLPPGFEKGFVNSADTISDLTIRLYEASKKAGKPKMDDFVGLVNKAENKLDLKTDSAHTKVTGLKSL